jgi:hypothetical protein
MLVLAALAVLIIAACASTSTPASSSSPAGDATAYVRTISTDAAQVQADEIKVGLDILHKRSDGAQDTQTAHDEFVNAKIDIVAAGSNVTDNNRLGNAELQMDDAINELK